jgi:glucose-1-phosphate thymidylyltransferase
MKVIIPVAGVGTRLRPHTHTVPKVLINIAGKPIISYIVDKLKNGKTLEFIFILGYLGDKIKDYLISQYPGMKFNFVYQKDRKGLGHAIYLAKEFIKPEEKVLIVLGDTIFDTDYSFLKNNASVLALKKVDNPQRFGIAVTDNDKIIRLVEKPKEFISNLALVGIYYIQNWGRLENALKYIIEKNIKTKNEYQLTDALQKMIEDGETFIPHEIKGWYDCGKLETVLSTNEFLLSKNNMIHNGKNSIIIPPCYIPKNAVIKNSVIGPYVSVGENVIIESSIIKSSIIDKNTEVYNMNLFRSIIGGHSYIKGHSRQMNIGDSSEVEF